MADGMNIVMAAGGSGGHVFPALRVAEVLRDERHTILFMATPGFAEETIARAGFAVAPLDVKGYAHKSFGARIDAAVCMLRALVQACREVHRFRPDVVAGFGGYAAFPVVFAARLMRIPTIIHEQNAVPGKANIFLSKVATRIAVTFPETKKYFAPAKTVVTGCPCHSRQPMLSRTEILKKFQLSDDKPIILILGGSQGSHAVNDACIQAAIQLKSSLNFQVIHITGANDHASCVRAYRDNGIIAHACAFCEAIEMAYAVADCVVSRAGAVTVSELAHFGLPAILIPYPFAGHHQKENARFLCDMHDAVMVEESELTPQRLVQHIHAIVTDGKRVKRRPDGQHAGDADTSRYLANEIIRLKK